MKQYRFRYPIILSSVINAAMVTSGIMVMFSYSTEIFENAGFDNKTSQYSTLIMAAFNAAGAFAVLPLMDRVGKKIEIFRIKTTKNIQKNAWKENISALKRSDRHVQYKHVRRICVHYICMHEYAHTDIRAYRYTRMQHIPVCTAYTHIHLCTYARKRTLSRC